MVHGALPTGDRDLTDNADCQPAAPASSHAVQSRRSHKGMKLVGKV